MCQKGEEDMSSYLEGQVHQLVNALEENGFTPNDLTLLGQFKNLKGIQNTVRGFAEITPISHVIDCDADPYTPDGWTVVEHIKTGQWQFYSTKIDFYLSKEQQKGKSTKGNELRKELKGKPVLNANVLDYMLKHPEIIPDEWKKDKNNNTRYIFFWGTIYRDSNGNLSVRCLVWIGGQWGWNYFWLDGGFHGSNPSAVLASSK